MMEQHKKPTYKYCIVPRCKTTIRNAPDKVFFLVPRGMDVRRKWCKIMKRDMVSPSTCLYCCEDHFNLEEDTDNFIEYKIMNLQEKQKTTLRLKKGILPHKFECQKDTQLHPPPERKVFLQRKHLEITEDTFSAPPAKQCGGGLKITESSQNDYLEAGPSTSSLFPDDHADIASISSVQLSVLSSFEPEISSESSWIIEDDSENETQIKNQMCSCMLTAIEQEPKMLLGLPKKSYYLIKLLSENIPLPTIDILITLKKIKLNEPFSILALQFGYTQSTISRIFSKCLPLLAEKMKQLIVWPTPQEIYKNLPISFRARYFNVVSIIDCLEIQIEKPSDAVHQSLTWSQYKKCNTLKYLISSTPDGLVNFISVGYSGTATDVMIVEDCGFLECLPPQTAVMADRGFKDISYMLGKKKCTLIHPPSVSKSTPSTKEDVKQSKRIAALRIHIERVISRLREFHMLLPHACVDHNLIPIIDEVIIVACGLINMQDV